MNNTNIETTSGRPDSLELDEARISVRSLWKVFGNNPNRIFEEQHSSKSKDELQQELGLVAALRDVSFDVFPGETFVVMGLSGSGKSTLVRCLIKLIEATSGEIIVDGSDVTNFNATELQQFRRSHIAMVFQNFGLLPHKNVLDNASYGLEVKGLDKEERYSIATEMLEKVGLVGWENARTHELSGGMQQRVGLARALAMDPSIMLMDEPFSGLDPLIRRQMREELSALQAEIQKTMVFITHDLDEAITIGDRIAIMRDGEIIQLGSPKDIITNPIDDFVESFTQGIPKTKVLDVAHILSAPEAIYSELDSVDVLRRRMDHTQSGYAIGLGDEGQYLGIIGRAQLDILSGDVSATLVENTDQDIAAVNPCATIHEALQLLSENDWPLPVVDDSNAFLGVVSQHDLLRTLASDT